MQKYADYIKQIEIDSLWSGTKHILWNLDRRVNILSGVNGVGKSTILNKVVKGLSAGGEFPSHLLKGVHLKVEPEEAKWIRFDVIRSADRPLLNSEMISKVDLTLVTELDWQLFQLQRKYLDYQVTSATVSLPCCRVANPMLPRRLRRSPSPRGCFRTSWTTCSARRARPSSALPTRSSLTKSARYCSLISCRQARSRCLPFCSLCWWKTISPMCSSWTSLRSVCTLNGRSSLSPWC